MSDEPKLPPPEKFENDLQDIDPATLVKSYGKDFIDELEAYVQGLIKERKDKDAEAADVEQLRRVEQKLDELRKGK